MTLQCVVLAGGLGTRMRPATDALPKALIPVCGRPFVDWQLELLASQGICQIVFCVGYRGDKLQQHVGNGSRWGLSVSWVDEGANLRGTAGALRLAAERDELDDRFFVLYGDSYLPIRMASVEEAWLASGLPALMTVMRNDGRWDVSNVIFDGARVVLYDKRAGARCRQRMRWIDYGLSILDRQVVVDGVDGTASADLADLMRELSRTDRLAGLEVFERFYEIGSPAGLGDLEAYLRRRVR